MPPVGGSSTFKYFHLRCRGEAPDGFKEHLAAAMAAHRAAVEQQRLQQQQQQRLQEQQQQQQQTATPWAAAALSGGSGSGGSGSWVQVSSSSSISQQQLSGGRGAPMPPAPAPAPRGLQAVDADLLTQLVDMVRSAYGACVWLLVLVCELVRAACLDGQRDTAQ
jgi:hypothetical protein